MVQDVQAAGSRKGNLGIALELLRHLVRRHVVEPLVGRLCD